MAPRPDLESSSAPDAGRSGSEIVITGIAGKFPKSSNVNELRDNLYNKVDMLTDATEKFQMKHPSLPPRMGQCEGVEYFDAQFFAVHFKQARSFDPMTRKLLEVACEAIIDSGVNPRSLRNKKIGVFVGSSLMETESKFDMWSEYYDGYGITGSARTMLANRISYWLGVTGPSYSVIGECCSSSVALDRAFHSIASGQCEAAVVGGTNLCQEPTVSAQIHWLGVTSTDGMNKSFSEDASGWVRAETVSAIFLQKSKDAKRVYAQLVHSKCEFLGMVLSNNLTYEMPTGALYRKCLDDFYRETSVQPDEVEYLEACGTGINKADYEELQNIDEVFCSGARKEPLMVGCVKSNMGNSEPASILPSIVKLCLAYQRGEISGNLHLEKPRMDVAGVRDGRIRLLDDHAHFRRGYTALNNYTLTGLGAHFLLKFFGNFKKLDMVTSSIPYLVCASGRVELSMNNLFKDLESKPLDPEQIALLHNIYKNDIPGFLIRGYNILTKDGDKTVSLSKMSDYYDGGQRPVWFVYSGMGSQWATMGAHLLRIPIFAAAVERCHSILKQFGLNLLDILTNPDPKTFDNILNSFVSIAAIQIGLTDVLTAVGIEPDYIIGHSVGELGCSYADGCLTAEEMILASYYRGLVSIQTPLIQGSMAAVGLSYHNINPLCPPEIQVACHNGPDSCTISGPADAMKQFVEHLKSRGVFAKEVACSNIAYHSKYIADAGPGLRRYMANVIKSPKPRSARWISSSVPQTSWNEPHAKLCSAEYLTNNLLNPVLFEEASRLIPDYAITIEIAPHGLLQAILKRSLPSNCINIPLTRRGHEDNVLFLLEAIGKLSMNGIYPQLQTLYPPIEFPVSAETSLLAHTTAWEHSEVWTMQKLKVKRDYSSGERNVVFTTYDQDMQYLTGHIVNGRNTVPVATQLLLVWETMAIMKGMSYKDLSVKFSNVRFDSDIVISNEQALDLTIMIQKGSGNFEIILQNATVARGQIFEQNKVDQRKYDEEEPGDVMLSSEDIYRVFRLRGYHLSGEFRILKSIDSNFTAAALWWKNNWATYIDGLLQVATLGRRGEGVSKPEFMLSLEINVKDHRMSLENHKNREVLVQATYHKNREILSCPGIRLEGLVTSDSYKKSAHHKIIGSSNKLNLKEHFVDKAESDQSIQLQVQNPGNLTTLNWVQVPTPTRSRNKILVQIHYARVGFSDLMYAQGRRYGRYDESKTENSFGTSFSGITSGGERVMGLVRTGALSSTVVADPEMLWPVPGYWSLLEAATVPQAYAQALYLLTQRVNLELGMSVLVTSGASPFGQAIISICLGFQCKLFVVVGDKDKKKMLLRIFPQLNEDKVFVMQEDDISGRVLMATEGAGCNIVINATDGNYRETLVQCVAPFSSLIDISLVDMDSCHFGMNFLRSGRTYKSADFSSIFDGGSELRKVLVKSMHKGINEGWIRPITSVVYDARDVTRAFQILKVRKNCGAVLVRIRCEGINHHRSSGLAVKAVPKKWCDGDKSYLVICSEEALGVEIVDHLIKIGARKFVLYVTNPHNGYLKLKVRSWRTVGVEVIIFNEDLSKSAVCELMLSAAETLGILNGIFIVRPIVPKSDKYKNSNVIDIVLRRLDKLTRSLPLQEFIILCPILLGLNNSSELDDFCKQRSGAGFPAKIIKCNTSPQRTDDAINSLLETLSSALNDIGKALSEAMTYPDVVITIDNTERNHQMDLTEICQILGLSQSENIDLNVTLSQMNIDYKSAKTLSDALKCEHSIYYTPEKLLMMTLKQITEEHKDHTLMPAPTTNPFGTFFSFYGDDYEHRSQGLVWMPTLQETVTDEVDQLEFHNGKDYLIVLPGMDGVQHSMSRICQRLKLRALVYLYIDILEGNTVADVAEYIAKDIKTKVGFGNKFYILGYSFGGLIALEMAAVLEKQGLQGKVFCLDASPLSIKALLKNNTASLTESQQQSYLLLHICHLMLKDKPTEDLQERLDNETSLEDKLKICLKWLKHENCSYFEMMEKLLEWSWRRIVQIREYERSFDKLKSRIILLRTRNSLKLSDDYGLGEISEQPVNIHYLEATHVTVPYHLKCSDIVNEELNRDS